MYEIDERYLGLLQDLSDVLLVALDVRDWPGLYEGSRNFILQEIEVGSTVVALILFYLICELKEVSRDLLGQRSLPLIDFSKHLRWIKGRLWRLLFLYLVIKFIST